jgi:dihydroflavonol-4-reductase
MNFVTGGTGYLGAHLICELLEKQQRVLALRRPDASIVGFGQTALLRGTDPQLIREGLEWAEGSLDDPGLLLQLIRQDMDVYHCAAGVGFSKRKGGLALRHNAAVTANLVNACLDQGIRKLCHVSSISTLGHADSGPISEEDAWQEYQPHSAYSASKYKAELEVWRGIAEGLPTVIINPSIFTGPGKLHNSFDKIISLVERGLTYYTSGSNAWVDVRDVARACILLTSGGDYSGRFIVSADNLPYRSLFDWMAEGLQQPRPKKLAGKTLLRIVSGLQGIQCMLSGRDHDLSADIVRNVTSHSAYSSAKFTEATGFRFIPIQLSVQDACLAYRQLAGTNARFAAL